MKKTIIFSIAISSLMGLAACNQAKKDSTAAADSVNKTKDTLKGKDIPTNNQAIPDEDAKFAVKAANGGMAEVILGQLAAAKGSSQQVKDFGAMMVKDHSKANAELKQIAAKNNITLPDSINTEESKLKADLSAKSGADFDKAYVKAMVDDHKQDISDFQENSMKVKIPAVQAFIKNTLPVLKMHLDAIEKIQSQLK